MIPSNYQRSAFIFALLSLALGFAGCETPQTAKAPAPQPAKPVDTQAPLPPPVPAKPVPVDMAPGGSKPVSFQRVIFNMEPGSTIGKIYWGPMKVEQDTIKAPSLSVGSEQFALIARDELRKCNYSLLGGENLIFGSDESAKARYQIGAQITKLRTDVYGSVNFWSGKRSLLIKGEMGTDWQVMDTMTRKVVFSLSTYEKMENDDDDEKQLYALFRANLRLLLADPGFVAFMRPEDSKGIQANSTTSSYETPLKLTIGKSGAKPRALPADFPALLDSIVAIKPGVGLGTGFIITEDGYALTAAHVVSGLKTTPVRLASGLVLDAEVLRIDENADVALIKIAGSSHKPVELVRTAPATGTDIFAVGNPAIEGLTSSVSKGIISGDREIAGRKFLQTDVSANPGNSGGPLLTGDGRAAGVVSWKVAAPGYEGLAFAVPVSEALLRLNIVLSEGP